MFPHLWANQGPDPESVQHAMGISTLEEAARNLSEYEPTDPVYAIILTKLEMFAREAADGETALRVLLACPPESVAARVAAEKCEQYKATLFVADTPFEVSRGAMISCMARVDCNFVLVRAVGDVACKVREEHFATLYGMLCAISADKFFQLNGATSLSNPIGAFDAREKVLAEARRLVAEVWVRRTTLIVPLAEAVESLGEFTDLRAKSIERFATLCDTRAKAAEAVALLADVKLPTAKQIAVGLLNR